MEQVQSWTTYQYAYNNPGMLNDAMGDLVDINRLAMAIVLCTRRA